MKKHVFINGCAKFLMAVLLSFLMLANLAGQADATRTIKSSVLGSAGQIIGSSTYKMVIAAGQSSPVGNLSAVNGDKLSSGFIPTLIPTDNKPPGKPLLVSPADNTLTGEQAPTFSWSIPADTDSDSLHFVFEIDTSAQFGSGKISASSFAGDAGFDPKPPVAQGTGSIRFTPPQPLNSGKYWWRVKAFDKHSYSEYSASMRITIDAEPPENPALTQNVCGDSSGSLNNIWQNNITAPEFHWQPGNDALSGVSEYHVYWGTDSSGTTITHSTVDPVYQPKQIDSSNTYFLRIRTIDGVGNAAESWVTIYRFNYDNIPPAGTLARTDSVSTQTTFLVTWGDYASDAGGSGLDKLFDIRMKIGSSGSWLNWKTRIDSTYAIFKNAMQDSVYSFEAASWDRAGNREAWTDIAETSILIDTTREDVDAPAAPRNIAVNGAQISPWQNTPEFSVTWENPHDPSGIKRALYKLGSEPQGNFDTTGTTLDDSLLVTATKEDGQPLFVWLEDTRGNLDFNLNARVLLRYDSHAPRIDSLLVKNADYDSTWFNPIATSVAKILLQFEEKHPVLPVFTAANFTYQTNAISLTRFEYDVDLSDKNDGSFSFQLEVADSAGNRVRDSLQVQLDQTPPAQSIAYSPDSSRSESFNVFWESGTDSSGSGLSGIFDILVQIDGNPWQTWLVKTILASSAYAGEHGHRYGFQALAFDNVGNRESMLDVAETITIVDTVQTVSSNQPPDAPTLLSPTTNFITNQATITLEWEVPNDADGDSLHFKVELDTKGDFGADKVSFTSQANPDKFSPMPAVAGSEQSVKFTISLNENWYWWRVSAWDGRQFGETSTAQKFMVDLTKPTVSHVPIQFAAADSQVSISADIEDALSGLRSRKLLYRKGGETGTRSKSITDNIVTIPSDYITSRGVEYALVAEDLAGNATRFPQTGFSSIQVVIHDPGESPRNTAGVPIPLHTGSAQTAYRMVSVPLKLDKSTIEDVLFDDLGESYDNTKWRLFDYGSGRYIEYPNTSHFTPGKAFFIIVKSGTYVITSGAGTTLKTGVEYNIPLAGSWNLIGNPYNFEISKNQLTLANGDPVTLWTYKGQWDTSSVLVPWEGYALKTTAATNLVVNTIDSTTSLSKRLLVQAGASPNENDWYIQIDARCEHARDPINFIGMRHDASDGWDANDLFEPPPIGEFITLYFPHSEWQENPGDYAADFRPHSSAGNSWDFEIRTNIPHSEVELTFEGITDLESRKKAVLIDVDDRTVKNLAEEHYYRYTSGSDLTPRRLTLITGTDEFIEEKTAGLNVLPESYHLSQNFPNPFNPETEIRFALPAPGIVRLTIYNVLGEEINALIGDRNYVAGNHSVIWNGWDKEGHPVASGIYLFRLQADGFSAMKKMILLK
ncbi:T9SS type A sorting domain-containing protein [candidate division KSB1 bacterium]|nr:T9SS type A sorting domain-containing protein [candidate division KSB1 bacterium]